jgi:hypothetical protein
MALDYARDIFALGAELEAAVRDRPPRGRALELRVGVADAVSKAIAYRLLKPVVTTGQPVRLVCHEWRLERLLVELAVHRLDLVISDVPIPPSVSVRAYNHHLGSSAITFFSTRALRDAHARPFPGAWTALHCRPARRRRLLRAREARLAPARCRVAAGACQCARSPMMACATMVWLMRHDASRCS